MQVPNAKNAIILQISQIFCRFIAIFEYYHGFTNAFFQYFKNFWSVFGIIALNKFDKLPISFRFHPRHIGAILAPSRLYPFKAHLRGVIKKEHRIAPICAHLHGRSIVAVDYPLVLPKHLRKTGKKNFLRHGGPIGIPIHHIEVIEGESRFFMKLAGKGAFSAAGASDNYNALHLLPFSFALSILPPNTTKRS